MEHHYAAVNDAGDVSLVHHLPFQADLENDMKIPPGEGAKWVKVPFPDIAPGDVYLEGTHYPRPAYGAKFDPGKREWEIDTELALQVEKPFRKAEIEARTSRIRNRGLAYQGHKFSMSESARLEWIALMAGRDLVSFPLEISTMDDEPFTIASHDELSQFLAAVMEYETSPKSPLARGRRLRSRIEKAKTLKEFEAIVDDRE